MLRLCTAMAIFFATTTAYAYDPQAQLFLNQLRQQQMLDQQRWGIEELHRWQDQQRLNQLEDDLEIDRLLDDDSIDIDIDINVGE